MRLYFLIAFLALPVIFFMFPNSVDFFIFLFIFLSVVFLYSYLVRDFSVGFFVSIFISGMLIDIFSGFNYPLFSIIILSFGMFCTILFKKILMA